MTETAELGRSARKRQAILDAARALFLRNGYAGTSMDDVAARAAVSKQTVYKHFVDKERLFTAIITGDIAETEGLTQSLVDALPQTQDLERDLREFARRHVVDVMQPHLVRMRRILIGEADRFPELAAAWYARGPERAHATFAGWFTRLAERGLLHVPDPLIAAEHFNWLILSIPLNRAMFSDVEEPAERLEYYADEAVRVFLAAYAITGDRA
ncbi:TetR/AcrR family transcriptional regulator [Pseudonocardia sp. DSM 110487]|uniref:TetR/AcrR family transcriptional regulator n=1 Tax=Pseudonocardia sp. DSM 110487 TaxID=2865833 RepID=UPI001C6A59C4|nr:TetR/AcrR family transcriptional regulator [Pseudonocardia sp. DSM 110487]QYN36273.1 TetR/AcrR family transcriptional regulator [Pseudonocardia sp. DSM 110487]